MSTDNSIGIDRNLWVKFTVASLDFDSILSHGRYTLATPRNWIGMHPPDWWVPEQLGESKQYYEYQELDSGSKLPMVIKAIWISKSNKHRIGLFVWATF